MISLARYAFLNAFLRARLRARLDERFFASLARAADLQEAAAMLLDTEYRPVAAAIERGAAPEAAEKLLIELEIERHRAILRHAKGAVAEFVFALLELYDVGKVERIIRIWSEKAWEERDGIIAETICREIPVEAMLKASGIEEIILLLEETPYRKPLVSAYPRYRRTGKLFTLESAIEIDYYRRLGEAVRGLGPRGPARGGADHRHRGGHPQHREPPPPDALHRADRGGGAADAAPRRPPAARGSPAARLHGEKPPPRRRDPGGVSLPPPPRARPTRWSSCGSWGRSSRRRSPRRLGTRSPGSRSASGPSSRTCPSPGRSRGGSGGYWRERVSASRRSSSSEPPRGRRFGSPAVWRQRVQAGNDVAGECPRPQGGSRRRDRQNRRGGRDASGRLRRDRDWAQDLAAEETGETLLRTDRLEKKLRELARGIGIRELPRRVSRAAQRLSAADLDEWEEKLAALDAEVGGLVIERGSKAQELEKLLAIAREAAALGPLARLDAGARHSFLEISTGRVSRRGFALLERTLDGVPHVLMPLGSEGDRVTVAALGLKKDKAALDAALREAAFEPVAPPAGQAGDVGGALRGKTEALRARIEALDGEIAAARGRCRGPLAELSARIACTRLLASARSRFRRTGSASLISGWVPDARVPALKAAIESATGGRYYLNIRPPAEVPGVAEGRVKVRSSSRIRSSPGRSNSSPRPTASPPTAR